MMTIPMMKTISFKPFGASTLAVSACLLLSGCFMTPGSFEASMDIRKNGDFEFSYDGEIFMMAMSDLSEMADAAEMEEPCIDDDSFEERKCTATELDERRNEKAQERAMMQSMMGGMDLSNPETAAQFAGELERQAGWDSVEYLGNGLFDIEFHVTSTLTHDFAFPVFEELPLNNSFVLATPRDDNRIRIHAPGFAAQGANPLQAMMGGMAGAFTQAEGNGASEGAQPENMPQMQGTFRLTTDATILANNTDEGPSASANGQMLEWRITPSNTVAPTALLLLEG